MFKRIQGWGAKSNRVLATCIGAQYHGRGKQQQAEHPGKHTGQIRSLGEGKAQHCFHLYIRRAWTSPWSSPC